MRMCVYVSECVFVCVGVNSHACYRWIVNVITDCNSCFLFQCVSFYFGLVCVRWSVCMFLCLRDYIVTKYLNSC